MNKLIIIALALSLAACGHSKKKTSDHKSNIDLTAAGATFPLPYYNLAFKTYKDSTGVSVTYGGIGSGGGIRSLKDRIVDFAGRNGGNAGPGCTYPDLYGCCRHGLQPTRSKRAAIDR